MFGEYSNHLTLSFNNYEKLFNFYYYYAEMILLWFTLTIFVYYEQYSVGLATCKWAPIKKAVKLCDHNKCMHQLK